MNVGGLASSFSLNTYLAGLSGGLAPRTSIDGARNADYGAGAASSRSHIRYDYDQGPDGTLYPAEAVSGIRRASGVRQTAAARTDNADTNTQAPASRYRAQPKSLGDYLRSRAQLSPSEEAAVFGSPDVLEDPLNNDQAQRRSRQKIASPFASAQNPAPSSLAYGIDTPSYYDLEIGPDGGHYPAQSDAGYGFDGSAQGDAASNLQPQPPVARNTQSRAAGLYASTYHITELETPLFSFAA